MAPRTVPRPGSRALLLAASAFILAGCASSGPSPSAAGLVLAGDLAPAVNAVLAAAPGCGLTVFDARRDETGRSAIVVLLEGGASRQPESAVVTLVLGTVPDGVACGIEGHPLAEYGMRPPDIRTGSEGLVCRPCSSVEKPDPTVRYSRGLAAGNVARATACLRRALEEGDAARRSSGPGTAHAAPGRPPGT